MVAQRGDAVAAHSLSYSCATVFHLPQIEVTIAATTQNDTLVFSFPEVHADAVLRVRTTAGAIENRYSAAKIGLQTAYNGDARQSLQKVGLRSVRTSTPASASDSVVAAPPAPSSIPAQDCAGTQPTRQTSRSQNSVPRYARGTRDEVL